MSSRRVAAKTVRRVKLPPRAVRSRPAAESSASQRAKQLAMDVERGILDGNLDVLTPEAAQALMAAACKLYSARAEAGHDQLPLNERSGVAATDVMTVASGLLRAVNLAVFELGMWQSWTGR
jgi:hypothetical protein